VAFQEHSLGDAAVLDACLEDMECVVIEVVEYCALAYSVVLVRVFNDWLLEIGVEV